MAADSNMICDRCSTSSEKLVKIELSEGCQLLCALCILKRFSITQEDIISEKRTRALTGEDHKKFTINLLKGRIGQMLMDSIFQYFGYEVFPYGYESYLTTVIKNLKRPAANEVVQRIRSTPDLFVYDRVGHKGFMTEIKATTKQNDIYSISKDMIEKYKNFWAEAVLIIIQLQTLDIYCKEIGSINIKELKEEYNPFKNKIYYVMSLKDHFVPIEEYFSLIKKEELQLLKKKMTKEIFDYLNTKGNTDKQI